jgi:hypothetical protein
LKTNGTATLARIASTMLPEERTTSSPVAKSVAVMNSGIFIALKVMSPNTSRSRAMMSRSSRRPNSALKPNSPGMRRLNRARRLRGLVTSRVHTRCVTSAILAGSSPAAISAP